MQLLCFSLFVCSAGCVFAQKAAAWKDDWLVNWEQRAIELQPLGCPSLTVDPSNCPGEFPRYLPVRVEPNYTQVIPMAIWQTWKSIEASGPNHYAAVMSFLYDNPEYEYHMFDDDSALDFMCQFYPEYALLYQQVVPGAVKADLWRLALIYRYGGVYFDTDCESVTPLRNFIWSNASVVTGLGVVKDFHQWALIYSPHHPIIKSALQTAVHRLRQLYNKQIGGNMVQTTGPGALSAGVDDVLHANKCTPVKRMQVSETPGEMVKAQQSAQCLKAVGVMQIYSGDFLGHNVLFKHKNADAEKNRISVYYGAVERDFASLFQTVPIVDAGRGNVKVGECLVKKDAKYRALARRAARMLG